MYPDGVRNGPSEAPIGSAPPRRAERDFFDFGQTQLQRQGRIVNGNAADYGEWPWQVSLRQWRTGTNISKCGFTEFESDFPPSLSRNVSSQVRLCFVERKLGHHRCSLCGKVSQENSPTAREIGFKCPLRESQLADFSSNLFFSF